MVKKWAKIRSRQLADYSIFQMWEKICRSPRTAVEHSFYILKSADWINIIPVTPEGKVVLIHQYRHATEEVTLEIPGGVIDAEDTDPAASARREMIEETGYDSPKIIQIGQVSPNPAILNNRCYTFLAKDATPAHPTSFDSAEDIAVELFDLADIPGMIEQGRIAHALVVVAFYHLERYARQHPGVLRE